METYKCGLCSVSVQHSLNVVDSTETSPCYGRIAALTYAQLVQNQFYSYALRTEFSSIGRAVFISALIAMMKISHKRQASSLFSVQFICPRAKFDMNNKSSLAFILKRMFTRE